MNELNILSEAFEKIKTITPEPHYSIHFPFSGGPMPKHNGPPGDSGEL